MTTVSLDHRAAPSEPTATDKPAEARTRLDSLTGLRMVAALMIFGTHYADEASFFGNSSVVKTLQTTFFAGDTAVSFFYVLSGFVLAWSARPQDTKSAFWLRRFAKIYPSHLVAFVASLFMMGYLGATLDAPRVLANLTLTQTWVPNDRTFWFSLNAPSWSLSCEFFFYLCFPFIMPAIRRLNARGLWAVMGSAVLYVIAMGYWSPQLEKVTGLYDTYLVYILPVSRLAEFVVGIALAFLVKRGHWRGPSLLPSLILAGLAVFVLTHHVPWEMHFAACTLVPYALVVAAAARADVRGTFSIFRHRHFVYLGEVSFAFYLVHEMVIRTIDHALVRRGFLHLPTVPLTIAVFCTALVAAVIMHEYVEKPCMKLLVRRRT